MKVLKTTLSTALAATLLVGAPAALVSQGAHAQAKASAAASVQGSPSKLVLDNSTRVLATLPPLMEFLGGVAIAGALWYGSREIAQGRPHDARRRVVRPGMRSIAAGTRPRSPGQADHAAPRIRQYTTAAMARAARAIQSAVTTRPTWALYPPTARASSRKLTTLVAAATSATPCSAG